MKSLFVDKLNNPVSLKWFIKWKIAEWHLRKWFEYEGMPKYQKLLKTEVENGRITTFFIPK